MADPTAPDPRPDPITGLYELRRRLTRPLSQVPRRYGWGSRNSIAEATRAKMRGRRLDAALAELDAEQAAALDRIDDAAPVGIGTAVERSIPPQLSIPPLSQRTPSMPKRRPKKL